MYFINLFEFIDGTNYKTNIEFIIRRVITMLELEQLERTLTNLIKGKSDVILYGNKSSGKTKLARKVLDDVLGQNLYVNIKSIFVSGKQSLFYLIGEEIMRLITDLDSRFHQQKDDEPKFMIENQHQSLQSWFKSLNKFFLESSDFFKKLPRIYFFIDNIEQMDSGQHFIKQFYNGLKRQVKYVKISLFFCGIAHKSIMFSTFEPFRNITILVMPRPNIKNMITLAFQESSLKKIIDNHNHHNGQNKVFNRLEKHVINIILTAFESIQYRLQNMYLISKSFLDEVCQYVKNNPKNAETWLNPKNQDHQKTLLRKLIQFGPVTLERTIGEDIKKNMGYHEVEEGQATFYMENYPNLLMTSLGLANGYPQTEDIKRFGGLKKPRGSKRKGLIKKIGQKYYKQDSKKIRHNEQRIIAIAEVLSQQSQCNVRLKQRNQPHHTLDFYGCMQYLRQEGQLHYYGKNSSKFGGKIIGEPKQSQVKDYIKKLGLQIDQFMNVD